MVIQKVDYPNFQALKRIIENKEVDGELTSSDVKEITKLATEHGISREEVDELLDLMEVSR